jgi:RPA family protein
MTESIEVPKQLLTAVEEAIEMIEKQMQNPHVYDHNTQEALDKISAYAARFKQESAYASLRGERTKATFYNKHSDALEIMINSLKYKIKVVTNNY